MKPLDHIKRLLDETHRIQWHGHCVRNPAAWVAINDIEIAIHKLRKAFEEKIESKGKCTNLLTKLFRVFRG